MQKSMSERLLNAWLMHPGVHIFSHGIEEVHVPVAIADRQSDGAFFAGQSSASTSERVLCSMLSATLGMAIVK